MAIITPRQGERATGKKLNRVICIATLNVGTMKNCNNEIVEMLPRRQKDI